MIRILEHKKWLFKNKPLITVEFILIRYPFTDGPSGLPERTNESAGAYAKACVAVAKELGVPYIDLWTKMQQFPDWEKSFLRYAF